MDESQIASVSSAASSVPLWQRLKTYNLKKLLLVFVALGVGLGAGIVGIAVSVDWYQSRPIAATEWNRLDVPSLSLRASLKTDYDGLVRYQFKVRPRTQDLIPAFSSAVLSHRDTISFTLHLYDKAGFEVCKTDVRPTPVVDSDDRVSAMEANDMFLYCSRSGYKNVDHWSLSYIFPKLPDSRSVEMPSTKVGGQRPRNSSADVPLETNGDDTLTGFDLYSGHLETLSGKTFIVYREGEKMTALGWETEQEVSGKGQSQIHFNCKTTSDCLIENPEKHQTVHAKLLR